MKRLKVFFIVLTVFALMIIIDFISIYTIKKPIFAFRTESGINSVVYKGLIYNTYVCEELSLPQVKFKWSNYTCSQNNFLVIGKIVDIKDNYIIIHGLSDENYLKYDEEAHISLNNNPSITGANNLIIGQYVKLLPLIVQEIYPPVITTSEIEVIVDNKEIISITDLSGDIDGFVCASALEKIYEDEYNNYYLTCIKSEYIIVQYYSSEQQTIKEALEDGSITINDLDNYNIDYYVESKNK